MDTESPNAAPHDQTAGISSRDGLVFGGLTLFGLFLLWRNWGRSGELLLDFSRELYVFWQVAAGKILYHDIDYRFGLLAPTLYGSAMRIFGPGLRTALALNLVVLIATAFLLYNLLQKMSDRFTATAGIGAFLGLFAFGTSTPLIQYNFLTPYNHDATLGFMIAIAAMLFVWRYANSSAISDAATAGVLTGICFLTKPEIFLATAAAVASGLCVAAIIFRYRIVPMFLAALALSPLPGLISFAVMKTRMPTAEAFAGTLGGWQFVFNRDVAQSKFYRHLLGTESLGANIGWMIAWMCGYVVLAGGIAFLAGKISCPKRSKLYAIASFIGALALLLIDDQHSRIVFGKLERGLPLATAAVILVWGLKLWRDKSRLTPAHVLRFCFAIFSLAMLLKILFAVGIAHYGFVLAIPAVMTAIIILFHTIPRRLEHAGANAIFFRAIVLALLAAFIVRRLQKSEIALNAHESTVHLTLGGTMHLLPQDAAAEPAIRKLQSLIPPGGTLAVFPDAAGLNYAAGRASSISFTVFNPFELHMTGEKAVIDALEQTPPDFVAIVETDESEYDLKTFGLDFGVQIQRWIDGNYEIVSRIPNSREKSHEIRQITIYRHR